MSERKAQDVGLNSIGPTVNLRNERNQLRQIFPPFRRRSNPEKLKSETDTVLTFLDRTYLLKKGTDFLKDLASSRSSADGRVTCSRKKPRLKPLFTKETDLKRGTENDREPSVLSEHEQDSSTGESKFIRVIPENQQPALINDRDVRSKFQKEDHHISSGKPAPCPIEKSESEVPLISPLVKPSMEEAPPTSDKLEFGGPTGIMVNMVTMPLTVYLLNAACAKVSTVLYANLVTVDTAPGDLLYFKAHL